MGLKEGVGEIFDLCKRYTVAPRSDGEVAEDDGNRGSECLGGNQESV